MKLIQKTKRSKFLKVNSNKQNIESLKENFCQRNKGDVSVKKILGTIKCCQIPNIDEFSRVLVKQNT